MTPITRYTFLSMLMIALTSCKKAPAVLEIRYGTSFGMCLGYCYNEISLKDTELNMKSSSRNQTPATKTCSTTITTAQWEELKKDFDINKFQKLKDVYGCPDCADGGAEWVEIAADGYTKKVTFEYRNAPDEIKNQVAKLRELMTSMNYCD